MPWEEYASDAQKAVASPPPDQGNMPWKDYQASKVNPRADSDTVVQEMHPELTTVDRLVVKNFSSSPEASIDYLRKKHPELEVKEQKGQIVVKRPVESEWRVLDPDTGFFSSDFLRDAGDVAYDVGAGALTGAATTFGAAAGLPGAVAAGGASSAGAEALRQKLGQMAGIENNMDTGQIALAGGVGSAIPVGGAALKGGYNMVTRKIGPAIAEKLSGVPREVYKDYGKNPETLKAFEADSSGFLDLINDTKDKLISAVRTKKEDVGKMISNAYNKLEEQGKFVDIGEVKASLDEKILNAAKAQASNPTEATAEKYEALKALKDKYFMASKKQVLENGTEKEIKEEIPNLVSPKVAFELKQQLKEAGKVTRGPNIMGSIANPAEKDIVAFGRDAQHKINDAVKNVDPEIIRLNDRYGDLINAYDEVVSAFGSSQKTLGTMRNLDKKSKETLRFGLQKILDKGDKDALEEALQTIQTQTYLAKPASMPLSGLGSTSTSRTIPAEAAGGSIGALIGNRLGHGSYASTVAGREAGAALGAMSGAPKNVRSMIDTVLKAEKAASTGGRPLRYGLGLSAWEALRQRQE